MSLFHSFLVPLFFQGGVLLCNNALLPHTVQQEAVHTALLPLEEAFDALIKAGAVTAEEISAFSMPAHARDEHEWGDLALIAECGLELLVCEEVDAGPHPALTATAAGSESGGKTGNGGGETIRRDQIAKRLGGFWRALLTGSCARAFKADHKHSAESKTQMFFEAIESEIARWDEERMRRAKEWHMKSLVMVLRKPIRDKGTYARDSATGSGAKN